MCIRDSNRDYVPQKAIQDQKVINNPDIESIPLFNPVQFKALSEDELAYWSSYGIGIDILNRYQVKAIQQLTGINKECKNYTIRYSSQEPMYGYQGRKHLKIYRPFSKIRFLYTGTMPENYVFGFEQLAIRGDILFITGGEKDVMSLAAQSFNAICFNSETAHIPKNIVRGLSYRFKHIVLLYDVDETGLSSMEKICKEYPLSLIHI